MNDDLSPTNKQFYSFGDFTVDADQKVLLHGSTIVPMTPKVFETLLILVENGGRIVTKENAMNRLWPDSFVEEANLTFNIRQLRKLLGDDARKPVYIETVARRGYRFIAPVVTDGVGGVKEGNIDSVKTIVVNRYTDLLVASKNRWWPAFIGLAVVLIVALGSWLLWPRSATQVQPSDGKVMLAVLPFQNLTGDAGQDYFSDGLTEEMIARLGNLSPNGLGVIGRTSVMHYKNSPATVGQIGNELQVQYVLEGSVRRDADRIRIAVQLIQTKDQTHVWAREYDREIIDLLSLQSEIAHEVANEIHLTLGGTKSESTQTSATSPNNYEVYDLYLKGQYFFNQRTVAGFERAIDYFQQATVKDPSYARAYAGLADCYALIGGYSGRPQSEFMPKARAAAVNALEIDPDLAEAHTALALIVQNYDWDWQTAEKEFQRAIELNPNYPTAHHWYAEHLAWQGRFDEALSESERARQLDPLSLIIAADNGVILYYLRQYDRAIEKFRSVREMDPNFSISGKIRAAYEQQGSFGLALEEIEKLQRAYKDQPWILSELAYAYGRSGQQTEAQHALKKLLELDHRQQVDPATIVWAYVGIGDKEKAFEFLEKAYLQHSNDLATLKVDPRYDPLRTDPRFQDLLHRVGLAQ